jgi:hypothetical protein
MWIVPSDFGTTLANLGPLVEALGAGVRDEDGPGAIPPPPSR